MVRMAQLILIRRISCGHYKIGLSLKLTGLLPIHKGNILFAIFFVHHTNRLDYILDQDVLKMRGINDSINLLPWDEKTFFIWNQDPFTLNGGSGYVVSFSKTYKYRKSNIKK